MNQMRRETRALRTPPQVPQADEELKHGLVRIHTINGFVEYCRCCDRYSEVSNQPQAEELPEEVQDEELQDEDYFYRRRTPRAAYLVAAIFLAILLVLALAAWHPIP